MKYIQLGIIGNSQVGKSTTSRLLASEFHKQGLRVFDKPFAEKLYKTCYALLGISESYMSREEFKEVIVYGKLTGRQFMIMIATKLREIDDNLFVNLTLEWNHCIYSDMRYPAEYRAVRERGGIFIRVNRNTTYKAENEGYLDSYEVDFTIDNNGTLDDLKNQIKDLIPKIIEKHEQGR